VRKGWEAIKLSFNLEWPKGIRAGQAFLLQKVLCGRVQGGIQVICKLV